MLSNVLSHAWSKGESLDLGDLIRAISDPPFDRIGVMDLETFYPASDRQKLAMRINGVLAAPGFSTWLEGEPLDVQRLLWTQDGKPRITILSIAHLSETERMFFVSTLLGRVVSWARTQSGTSSLRAILYMDEVFGFLPPVAKPPSKRPLLTLLKQTSVPGPRHLGRKADPRAARGGVALGVGGAIRARRPRPRALRARRCRIRPGAAKR